MQSKSPLVIAVFACFVALYALVERDGAVTEEVKAKQFLVEVGYFDEFWKRKQREEHVPSDEPADDSADGGMDAGDNPADAPDAGPSDAATPEAAVPSTRVSHYDSEQNLKWRAAYQKLGAATVLIKTTGMCHGTLGVWQDEVVVYTAAHCVNDDGKKKGGKIFLSSYWAEPNPGKNRSFYVGYGYLDHTPAAATFDPTQILMTTENDAAVIRGLVSLQNKESKEVAVELNTKMPPLGEHIYGIHWQNHCWNTPGNPPGQGCAPGQLLVPMLGRIDRMDGRGMQVFNLPAYGGDSGSGIVDQEGKLIGIVAAAPSEKGNEDIITVACPVPVLRSFVETSWRDPAPRR